MKIPELKHSTIVKITLVGLAIIFLPFAYIGAAVAYDNFILSQMENALSNNVQAAHSSLTACEANYQALLRYKQDNKIPLTGTGSPCAF